MGLEIGEPGTKERERLANADVALELPEGVSAVAFTLPPPETALRALSGFEADGLPAGVALKRRAEFLAGRHAAVLALEKLGRRARIGRNLDGTPAWPAGVTGSISHGGGIAWAAVASVERYASLGIDSERFVDDAEEQEMAPSVAQRDELLLLRSTLPHARPGERLSLLFSCKESLFKCLFPITREFMEFGDARLIGLGRGGPRDGSLTLRLERDVGSGFCAGATLTANYCLSAGRVESAVLLDSAVL